MRISYSLEERKPCHLKRFVSLNVHHLLNTNITTIQSTNTWDTPSLYTPHTRTNIIYHAFWQWIHFGCSNSHWYCSNLGIKIIYFFSYHLYHFPSIFTPINLGHLSLTPIIFTSYPRVDEWDECYMFMIIWLHENEAFG